MNRGLVKDNSNHRYAYQYDVTMRQIASSLTWVMALIMFLTLVLSSKAQAEPHDYSRFLTRISPSEGLSQSEVTQTIQDKEGFIWIATKMGLNRYDGYKVRQIEGPEGIFTKEEIGMLFLDMQGYLWVSTLYTGLYRVNPTTFATEQYFNGKLPSRNLQFAEVSAIVQQDENTLWLGIENTIQKFDIANKSFTEYFGGSSNDNYIRDLYLRDNLLFAASTNGVYQLDITTKQHKQIPHTPSVSLNIDNINTKKLLWDEQLGLLVGTVEGLYRIPKTNSEASPPPEVLIPGLNIWDLEKTGNDYLVATDKGLFRYITSTRELQYVLSFSRSNFQTSDNNIQDLFRDKSGNLWLASRSQGVLEWSEISTRFQHITSTTEPALSNENIWAMYQDNEDILWIGSNNGLNRLDLKTNTIAHSLMNEDLKSIGGMQVIIDIFPDDQDPNKLWIHNDIGLYSYDKSTGKLKTPYLDKASEDLIKDQIPYGYYVLNNENIFFYTDNSHFHYNSISGKVKTIELLDQQLDPTLSWAFLAPLPNRPDTVLLATSGHLYQFSLRTKELTLIYKVRNYQPQTYDNVDGYLIDQDGILWIAFSGEGLVGLDSDTYEERYRFDTSNKLQSNLVYRLHLDQFNNLWMSSQAGLYKLNADRTYFEAYMASDGLLSSEFNGSSSTELNDGRLVFGSPLGISFFNPTQFQAPMTGNTHYAVHLSNVSLLSEKTSRFQNGNLDQVELEYDQYGLKVEYSTLEFYQQNRTKYKITLSGPQAITIDNYYSNEFLLPRLIPGEYQLAITAISPFYGNESRPLQLNITVNSSPWFTTQAKISYAIILLAISFFYYVNRRVKQAELMRLHKRTEASRNRLHTALYGSNSGIWDYRLDKDSLYAEQIPNKLGAQVTSMSIPMKQFGQKIKPEQLENMKKQWYAFLGGKTEDWDVDYQVQGENGSWVWYRVVGRVIERDDEGKPTRVIGTYTNITKTKASEDQARLFGEAFSQINDWVLILDSKLVPITANESFKKAFSLKQEISTTVLRQLLTRLGDQKYQEFKEILTNLKSRESWQGEEVIETPSNEKHPVLIKINAIARQLSDISHYVIVISDITSQKIAEEKLRHLAHYDYLTDLPNRKLLFEKIEHKIRQNPAPFAILFIDLDKFKQVNDLYGHFVGDKLLKRVGEILLQCVDHYDIVARQSGDEFIVLINQFNNINDISHIGQCILDKLSQSIILDEVHVHITSSVGIAIYPDDSDDANELIKKADLAMIHAKNSGRGEFQYFTQDMNEKAHVRITLENDLREACLNNEFINFYQPIVDSTQDKMVGVELLMRWSNKGQMIPPGIFIPIAEETGLISQMTIQAIDRALQDYQEYFSHLPNFYISINLSPIHILQEGLGDTLISMLQAQRLSPQILRLEITESTLLTDLDIALRRLEELRSLGFKLLLDDFGTGYSSMGYLSKFSIDYIKIDKSFIHSLEHRTNRSIVDSIVTLAKNLDLDCVIEGVETQEQLDYVNNLGCDLIQGYFFSKPMPANEVAQLGLFSGSRGNESRSNEFQNETVTK